MKLPLIDGQGNAAGEIEADDSVFGIKPNLAGRAPGDDGSASER